MPNNKPPWLAIRQEQPRNRQRFLIALSFLLPIAFWCFLSYTPGVWKPFMKITIGARIQSGEAVTVFAVNQKVPREYFDLIREQIAAENSQRVTDSIGEGSSSDAATGASEVSGETGASGAIGATKATGLAAMIAKNKARDTESTKRRENLVVVRQLAPIAVAAGWVKPLGDAPSGEEQNAFDLALIEQWLRLGTDADARQAVNLDPDNTAVAKHNAIRLAERNADPLTDPPSDAAIDRMPAAPLLKLLPEGFPANPSYLPAPHEVWVSGIKLFKETPKGDAPSMIDRLVQSVSIVFYGFALAALVGVPIAVLAGTYDLFSKLLEPFIDFFRYMPAPAFSLALVAMFGSYDAPKIALVFVGTFFQLVLVVANTTRTLDAALIEAARTLGAKGRTLLMTVIVPGILPKLYTDLRILLGWAWTWLVIAELIGVKSGLTEVIDTQGTYRNFDRVYPVIILIGIIGFTTDQMLQALARKLFPYIYEQRPGPIQRLKMALVKPAT